MVEEEEEDEEKEDEEEKEEKLKGRVHQNDPRLFSYQFLSFWFEPVIATNLICIIKKAEKEKKNSEKESSFFSAFFLLSPSLLFNILGNNSDKK